MIKTKYCIDDLGKGIGLEYVGACLIVNLGRMPRVFEISDDGENKPQVRAISCAECPYRVGCELRERCNCYNAFEFEASRQVA